MTSMEFWGFFVLSYLAIVNIAALVMYVKETASPSPRLPAFLLILLPIIGGSVGAVVGNYFCDTEYRELRSKLHKPLAFLPPIMLILQIMLFVYCIGIDNCAKYLWDKVYVYAGILGRVLLVVNAVAFVLVVIRKVSYYVAPIGNKIIPDLVLVPILLLGGATGGVMAKILFNFKEDWSCNSTMIFQNFLYNWGMFAISVVHIGLILYFIIL